ncbi:hypothetical protein MPH_07641 [Macrophomina phaseolina MS6]|uniref:Fucose-specific lectin n=1 Tax=Macrophomina phaseolina (strain MS6) TaxID=1126212 RepID=K2RYC5_MACPH|nr:hypothetical protein MPH_07641 [Macrophomina phaseolina MS6]
MQPTSIAYTFRLNQEIFINATNVTEEPVAKLGTPLAAHIYGSVETDYYEYHLFFLDADNRIWGLVSEDPDDIWKFSAENAIRGDYSTASYSKLASYGRQCGGNCGNATSIVIWQSDDDNIWLAGYQPEIGWLAFANDAELDSPPVQGTAISTLSMGADEGLMSIYINTGRPTELHFNRTDGWASNGTLDGGTLQSDAAIAALITNYDTADAETAEVNVIATKPGSSGGVSLWLNGTFDSSWLNSDVEPPFSSVSNSSAITSNQAGMVYAMERGKIAEWRWEDSNSSYIRVGIVETHL